MKTNDKNENLSRGNFDSLLIDDVIIKILKFFSRTDLLNMRSTNKAWLQFIDAHFRSEISLIPLHKRLGIKDLNYTHYPPLDSKESKNLKELIPYIRREEQVPFNRLHSFFEEMHLEVMKPILQEERFQGKLDYTAIKIALGTLSPITLFYFSLSLIHNYENKVNFEVIHLAAESILKRTKSIAALILINEIKYLSEKRYNYHMLSSKEVEKLENEIRKNMKSYFKDHVGNFLEKIDEIEKLLAYLLFYQTYDQSVKNIRFLVNRFYEETLIYLKHFSKNNSHNKTVDKKFFLSKENFWIALRYFDIERQFYDFSDLSIFLKFAQNHDNIINFFSLNSSLTMKKWKITELDFKKVNEIIGNARVKIGEFFGKKELIEIAVFTEIRKLYDERFNWLLENNIIIDNINITNFCFFPMIYIKEIVGTIFSSTDSQGKKLMKVCENSTRYANKILEMLNEKPSPIAMIKIYAWLEKLSKWFKLDDLITLFSSPALKEEPLFKELNEALLELEFHGVNIITREMVNQFVSRIEFEEKKANAKNLMIFFSQIHSQPHVWFYLDKIPLVSLYNLFLKFQRDGKVVYFLKLITSGIPPQLKKIDDNYTDKKDFLLAIIDEIFKIKNQMNKIDKNFISNIGVDGLIYFFEKKLLTIFLKIIFKGDILENLKRTKNFNDLTKKLFELSKIERKTQGYITFKYKNFFDKCFKENSLDIFIEIKNIKIALYDPNNVKIEMDLFSSMKGLFEKTCEKIISSICYPIDENQIKKLIAFESVMIFCSYQKEMFECYSISELMEKNSYYFSEEEYLKPSLLQVMCYQRNMNSIWHIHGMSNQEAYVYLYPSSIYISAMAVINQKCFSPEVAFDQTLEEIFLERKRLLNQEPERKFQNIKIILPSLEMECDFMEQDKPLKEDNVKLYRKMLIDFSIISSNPSAESDTFLKQLSKWVSLELLHYLVSYEFRESTMAKAIEQGLPKHRYCYFKRKVVSEKTLEIFIDYLEREEKNAIKISEEAVKDIGVFYFSLMLPLFKIYLSKADSSLLSLYKGFLVFQSGGHIASFLKLGIFIIGNRSHLEKFVDEYQDNRETLLACCDVLCTNEMTISRINLLFWDQVNMKKLMLFYEKGLLEIFLNAMVADQELRNLKNFVNDFESLCDELKKLLKEDEIKQAYRLFVYQNLFVEKFDENSLAAFSKIINIKKRLTFDGIEEGEYHLFDLLSLLRATKDTYKKVINYLFVPIDENQIKELIDMMDILRRSPYFKEILKNYSIEELIRMREICLANPDKVFKPSLLELVCFQRLFDVSIFQKIKAKSDGENYNALYQTSIYPLARQAIQWKFFVLGHNSSLTSAGKHLLENASTVNETDSRQENKKQKIETSIIQEDNDKMEVKVSRESMEFKYY